MAAVCAFALYAPSAAADEAAARREYAAALEHARSGRLMEARRAFEAAYRESPHYLVLYNLSRVCRDLGDVQAAKNYLARYLAEGGERLSAEERLRARRELDELEAVPAPEKTAQRSAMGGSPPASENEPVMPAASPRPELALQPSRVPQEQPGRALRASATLASSQASPASVEAARWSGFSLGLAAAGALVVGAGGAILIWNGERRETWESEDAALASTPNVAVDPDDGGTSLAAARAAQQRADRNDALAASIDDFDTVALTTVLAGSALIVTAVTVWLTAGKGPALSARSNRVRLAFQF